MSKGPGKWQRAILTAVEESGSKGVQLTHSGMSPSDSTAILRAARALEHSGKIHLARRRVEDISRMLAFPASCPQLDVRLVTGLDGKTYRL